MPRNFLSTEPQIGDTVNELLAKLLQALGGEPKFGADDDDLLAGILVRINAGAGLGGPTSAVNVLFDNSASGLTAADVQAAIDELAAAGSGAPALLVESGPERKTTALPAATVLQVSDIFPFVSDPSGVPISASAEIIKIFTDNLGALAINRNNRQLINFAGDVVLDWQAQTFLTKNLVKAVTTTYTLDTTTLDQVIVANSATPFTITLTDATAAANLGRQVTIKNKGLGAVTLQSASGSQIFSTSAVSNVALGTGDAVTIICDQVFWLIT